MKGTIFTNYWIQCGYCEYSEALAGTRKEAREAAQERGWRHRKAVGFACPDCVQEIVEAQNTKRRIESEI